jgi:hypothetical protein
MRWQSPKHKRFMWLVIIATVAALVLLGSCAPGERIQRICKKHPEACKADTQWITVRDTFLIPAVVIDTVFKPHTVHDTLVLRDEHFTIKYFYNIKDSTGYLAGKTDTIVKVIEKRVPVTKLITVEGKQGLRWYFWVLFGVAGTLAIIVIWKYR